MSGPARQISLLATAFGAVALFALAAGLSAAESTTTSTAPATASAAPAASVPTSPPAPAAPARGTSGATLPQAGLSPAAAAAPPQSATLPRVTARHAQSSTRGGAPAAKPAPARSAAGGRGSAKTRSARARASARAPASAFSGSLAGIPASPIEGFRVPPFLLPIYRSAGTAYGVPWQVLAAINEIASDYGRDLRVSSAGAEGWMQFLPASWAIYGVDVSGDGFKDPYDPADAIYAAARYLRAAGAASDLSGAIYAYDHAGGYVESVLLRARLLGGTPPQISGPIGALTGSRFPVHARSHFSDGFPPSPGAGSARRIPGTTIYSEPGAPVIAVQDGQIIQIGESGELGRFISLRDAYGDTYTYAQLASVASQYPVLKPYEPAAASGSLEPVEPPPSGPASAGTQPASSRPPEEPVAGPALAAAAGLESSPPSASAADSPSLGPVLALQTAVASVPSPGPGFSPAGSAPVPAAFRAGPNEVYLHELRPGAMVIAGTVLGHVGAGTGPVAGGEAAEAHMLFQIRPAGAGAPLIDPKPILDGWVELEDGRGTGGDH